MGLFIITMISIFDPNGLGIALIIVIPAIAFIFGFIYSSYTIWLAAALTPLMSIMVAEIGNDPLLNGMWLYDAVSAIAPFVESLSAITLLLTAVIGFYTKSVIGGESMWQMVNILIKNKLNNSQKA